MKTQDRKTKIGKTYGSKRFHQLAILLMDGSGSMTDKGNFNMTKAEEVHLAIRGLFGRLKSSKVANCFSATVLTFDESAKSIMPVTSVPEVDELQDFDPTKNHGGGTKIFTALEKAEQIADSFLDGIDELGVPHSVMILLLSDGLCFEPKTTISVAERIKSKNQNIQIATCYFGINNQSDPDAQQLMQQVCSNPVQFYATVRDEESLRNFFIKSLSQSTGSSELMVVSNDRR